MSGRKKARKNLRRQATLKNATAHALVEGPPRLGASALITVPPPAISVGPIDGSLLEKSRSQWLFGDWNSLGDLTPNRIEGHPDRARLALLAAAGLVQIGDMIGARRLLHLAKDWGCDPRLISRLMISGLWNKLGNAASLLDDKAKALGFFNAAIQLGVSGGDTDLFSRARFASQAQPLLALAFRAGEVEVTPSPRKPNTTELALALIGNPLFNAQAFTIFRQPRPSNESLFIYLDVKSLPRSGLHITQNTLRAIMQERFSFCEWYHEPGCCKKMPCALTGHRDLRDRQGESGLRMIKSHDFDLNDPDFPTTETLRRYILIRDPLFILTSWWSLENISWYTQALQEHGISTTKLFYMHEPEVLSDAYRLIDEIFVPPSEAVLLAWLDKQSSYILKFVHKWGLSTRKARSPFQQIVRYEETPNAVVDLLTDLRAGFSPDALERLRRHLDFTTTGFEPRKDPFKAPSAKLTQYLHDHAAHFQAAAVAIEASDPHGLMTSKASNQPKRPA